MVNFNGVIVAESAIDLSFNNRAYSYGDSIFDTHKFINGGIQFGESHYFRLMASMRMLRMQIPIHFTLDFFEQEVVKTVQANGFEKNARVKFTVFRKKGGYYTPNTNEINFIIEVSELVIPNIEDYSIDIFKDYYLNSGLLSTIKTNNRILNVVASIYASENDLHNTILLNEKKNVVEVTNANIFLIKGDIVSTPAISEGCINGIVRKKLIEVMKKGGKFTMEESEISPFDIQKADSIFITNSIIGIQEVKKYRKKIFNTHLVDIIKSDFETFILNSDS